METLVVDGDERERVNLWAAENNKGSQQIRKMSVARLGKKSQRGENAPNYGIRKLPSKDTKIQEKRGKVLLWDRKNQLK